MSLNQKTMDKEHIRNVQKVLNDKLGSNLTITGEFDILTSVALRRFQQHMNLPASGEYDEATQALIEPSIKGVSVSSDSDMVTITLDQFTRALQTTTSVASNWYQPMIAAMVEFGVSNKLDVAAFLAQIGHETNGLQVLAENLNYRPEVMARVWPTRYGVKAADGKTYLYTTDAKGNKVYTPNDLAKRLAALGPKAIANNVYANRLGNGDEASGDGWNHRGQGPIQLTGKENQEKMGIQLGVDLVNHPEQLQEPVVGSRSAGAFWKNNGISAYATKGDFDGASDKVNIGKKTAAEGDAVGYTDRKNRYVKIQAILS